MKTNDILKRLTLTLAILFIACEQDRETFTTEFGDISSNVKNGARSEYLTAEQLPKTIDLLRQKVGNKSSKFGENDDFIETEFGKVYLERILHTVDPLGGESYTFSIIPEEYNPNVIFRLVVGQDNGTGETPINILALEKSEEFLQQEQNGDISTVKNLGKLYTYPFEGFANKTAKGDCPPNDITIDPTDDGNNDDSSDSGSGGGGGTSGDGTSGPGSGSGDGGDTGTGGEDITIEWTCGCSPKHDGGNDNDGCTCKKPDVIIINFSKNSGAGKSAKSGDCNDLEGPVGINLSEAGDTIEENIQSSNLDPCSSKILTQLKKLAQNDIAKILMRFGAVQSDYDWEIKTTNPLINPNNDAETDWKRDSNDQAIEYDYLTHIKPNYVNQATQIAIARTILHEMLHAYLISLVDDALITGSSEVTNFPILWNALVNKTYNNNPNRLHHEEISRKFITPLQDALKEWDGAKESNRYYEDLAWGALEGTSTFNLLYPNSSTSRNRILNTNRAEDTNSAQGGVTPKSNPCN